MTIRYYPMKIIHNKAHPICSMTYETENDALNYGYSRGLQRSEIVIKELFYSDDSWDTHIDFDNIDNDIE